MLQKARDQNLRSGFTALRNIPENMEGETYFLEMEEWRKLTIEAIANQEPKPLAFLKHQNFLNFSEFEAQKSPIYVNFVRHPVERIISWYYYIRAPDYQLLTDERTNSTQLKTDRLPLKHLKTTLEECFEKGLRGCVIKPGASIHDRSSFSNLPEFASQMSFFCGHEPICDKFESEELFSRAKEVSTEE